MATSLPKYRDMLRRLAQDPVGQVLQFELLMRLFFQHVLNVRPGRLLGSGAATEQLPIPLVQV